LERGEAAVLRTVPFTEHVDLPKQISGTSAAVDLIIEGTSNCGAIGRNGESVVRWRTAGARVGSRLAALFVQRADVGICRVTVDVLTFVVEIARAVVDTVGGLVPGGSVAVGHVRDDD